MTKSSSPTWTVYLDRPSNKLQIIKNPVCHIDNVII